MLTRTLLFLLLACIGMAYAVADTYPGSEVEPELEPFLKDNQDNLESESEGVSTGALGGSEKRSAKMPRELVARAQYCVDPGYGLCPGRNYCCPLGGWCCSSGPWCCRAGTHCCTFRGCCPNTHNCWTTWLGHRGCCKKGKSCWFKEAPKCTNTEHTPCAGEKFCCRPGDKCSRDSSGNPVCTPSGESPLGG